MKTVDRLLLQLEDLIRQNRFEELETETIEIKSVPASGGEWTQVARSVMAFLNKRGGVLLLGVKEEQTPKRHYRVTGWRPEAEAQVVRLAHRFTDSRNQPLDVSEWLPKREERELLGQRVLILYVDELPAELKFCFLDGEARERVLTGDREIPEARYSEAELGLCMCAGRLVDERMEELFRSFDGYIENKLQGRVLSNEQKRVLAYLMKSEWANRDLCYTIILTPDNNHYSQLQLLEDAVLISRHTDSPPLHPIYVVDRVLMRSDYTAELRTLYGPMTFDPLSPLLKDVLGVIYRFNNFSKNRWVSARQAALILWWRQPGFRTDVRAFEGFYRKVKYAFNKLEKAVLIRRDGKKPRYQIITSPSHPLLS